MAYYPSTQRYVDQAMRNYGPGSAFNNNAWAAQAVSPWTGQNPFAVGGSQGRGFSVQPSQNFARTLPQPLTGSAFAPRAASTNPRRAENVIARGNQLVPGQAHPATGRVIPGTATQGPNGQTTVRYPNGSQTVYDIINRIVNPTPVNRNPDNRTWGAHAGPGVTNDGTLINATDDLGLGPFMQYIQNIATAAAPQTNTNQYQGSAPPPVAQPRPNNPTPTPTPTPTRPPVQQPQPQPQAPQAPTNRVPAQPNFNNNPAPRPVQPAPSTPKTAAPSGPLNVRQVVHPEGTYNLHEDANGRVVKWEYVSNNPNIPPTRKGAW